MREKDYGFCTTPTRLLRVFDKSIGSRRIGRASDVMVNDDDGIVVNGEELPTNEETAVLVDDWLFYFVFTQRCRFCGTSYQEFNHTERPMPGYRVVTSVYVCRVCGHWQYWIEKFEQGQTELFDMARIANLQSFNDALPEGCFKEIAQHVRRKPKLWHEIPPSTLEHFVAEIFRAWYPDATVRHVGRPDDGGVDVILIMADGKKWLIQVKRRENPNASEGPEVLRSLLGVMVVSHQIDGVVVSTADHFTYRAFEFAGMAKAVGRHIRLADRHTLEHLVEPLLHQNIWLRELKGDLDGCGFRSLAIFEDWWKREVALHPRMCWASARL